jgi:hypothetical protein
VFLDNRSRKGRHQVGENPGTTPRVEVPFTPLNSMVRHLQILDRAETGTNKGELCPFRDMRPNLTGF